TLLPSPVSRANSGNSNDAASEVLVGTAAPPTTTLPPAVSISESPKSMSPNFQRHKYESAMQHIDSRNLSAHAQQRSASPQLIYPHSRLMHSPTIS
ncbi:Type I HSP40 co-chaperone, partial [Ascosphaera pollenicola]